MKLRQCYITDTRQITVRYTYTQRGNMTKTEEINPENPLEFMEYSMPAIEVTDEFFQKVISHPDLKETLSGAIELIRD